MFAILVWTCSEIMLFSNKPVVYIPPNPPWPALGVSDTTS